jgi:fructose-bisphosphate aldolase class I
MIPTIEKLTEALMVPGKGILAADESASTVAKRLGSIELPDTEENERAFRNVLFTTPNLNEYLSGVILYDATMHRKTDTGLAFPFYLESKGIMPGIKVDKGVDSFPNAPEERISRGLDGLDARLKEYYALGARFTKWRSVIRISDETPTKVVLNANAHVLAQYAAIVQSNHMVPIVEPEVIFDEKYTLEKHTLERSAEVLTETLSILFETLTAYKVSLKGLILKTSMALPGRDSGIAIVPDAVAVETVKALKTAVPSETGGIVFLSGGQTPVEATQNLNAIASMGKQPWPMTFSYSRALEEPVLLAWKGLDENKTTAQQALLKRLSLNVAARNGAYKNELE